MTEPESQDRDEDAERLARSAAFFRRAAVPIVWHLGPTNRLTPSATE